MIGYIYKCTFRGKIYIGESLHALDKGYLGTGLRWRQAISGCRQEVTKEILETITDVDRKSLKKKMWEREIYWIAYYNSTNPEIGYNISPGGNLMAEESLLKLKETNSKIIRHVMITTECRQHISESLKRYKKLHGVSAEHRKHLSNSLKGRNVGCFGDSRSIQVYCIVDGNKYSFHNKVTAARWWFENYPFSEKYAEITYTRAINNSIDGVEIRYRKKPINRYIKWYVEEINLSKEDSVYCIFNNNTYEFSNLSEACKWWHNNYPIMETFDEAIYLNKLTKNVKGFEISYRSVIFDRIKWYRKEVD